MKFIADEDALTIKLQGIEIALGLKRRLVIPRVAITSLEWHEEYVFAPRVWRVGGAGIPGVIFAGHFRGGGEKFYMYLQNPRGWNWTGAGIISRNTLVITTQEFPYKQVLLSCQPDIGASLINWWQGSSPSL